MSSIIDNREQITTLDASNVLGSIEQLPQQVQHAWEIGTNLEFPQSVAEIRNVIVMGMGGSNLGAHVVKSVYEDSLSVPIEIVPFYRLPKYASANSLIILSSYSGTTEEILTAAQLVKENNLPAAVITSGGALLQLASENQWPTFVIDPQYNASNQPRMAIGYSIVAFISLLAKAKVLSLDQATLDSVVGVLKQRNESLKPESEVNAAKTLAYAAVDRLLFLVAAEHLRGAAHVFNNQLNENSKQLTVELQIPEMNHHYMEALTHPKTLNSQAIFYFFNSKHYLPRIQTRFRLTEELAKQQGYETEVVTFSSATKLAEAFEIIQLGAYVNFYLSMLNGIDPAPIPSVDWFKQQLSQA